jgi:hypothetical protein
MRIPSGLDDGNLYRRRHQKGNDSFAYRRLLRLILALVLIIVLMQQAGKPNLYRIFFTDPSERSVSTQSLANRAETIPDDSEEFAEAAGATSSDRVANDAESARDRSLLESVDDGAIWKANDRPAFYRLLQGAPLPHLGDLPTRRVGVIPLLQQPAVYLRTPVSIHGMLARASRLDATFNDFGVSSYWELWLQPADGSNRPVVFYTREVPAPIAKWEGTEFLSDSPEIDVEGIYLKRLAYRSAAGTELAPVIVGRIKMLEPPPSQIVSTAAEKVARPSLSVLVLLAVVLGTGLTFAIFVATTLTSRRIRQARLANQHVPDHLFESLANDVESREPS